MKSSKYILLFIFLVSVSGYSHATDIIFENDSVKAAEHFINGVFNAEFLHDYEAAISEYNKALDILYPATSWKLNSFQKANLSSYKEDFDVKAAEDFTSIDRYVHTMYFYTLYRGKAYYKLKEWDKAHLDIGSCMDDAIFFGYYIDVEYSFIYANLLLKKGDYESAIYYYNTVLDEDDGNTSAMINRGLCHYGIEQYEEAFNDFNLVIEEYGMIEMLSMRASASLLTKRFFLATIDYTKLLENEYLDEYLYNRGLAFLFLNAKTRACSDFDDACDMGYKKACDERSLRNEYCSTELNNNKPYENNVISKIELPIISEGNMKFILVKMGSREYKYLIDTGASDIIISSSIETELINSNILTPNNYSKSEIYEIADGSTIELKKATLPYIHIGGQKFNNIEVAIGDENSSLLLGMSFLSRFQWNIINNKLELTPKK